MKINEFRFDKNTITKISSFFVIAFVLSYLLNLLPNPLTSFGYKTNLNYGFGPFVSSVIVCYLYKKPVQLKLFSDNPWIRKIELIGLGIFFIGSFIGYIKTGKSDYTYITFGILLSLVYTLLEEAGWRVFLGNELGKYSFAVVFGISTILWFLWHYSFKDENLLANPLQFLGMIAIGSAGMAQFYKQTKSWLIVALTHAVISVNLPTFIIFLAMIIGFLKYKEMRNF